MNIPQPTAGDIERDNLIRNRQGADPAETFDLVIDSFYAERPQLRPYPVNVYRRIRNDRYEIVRVHPRPITDDSEPSVGQWLLIVSLIGAFMWALMVGGCYLAGWMIQHGIRGW